MSDNITEGFEYDDNADFVQNLEINPLYSTKPAKLIIQYFNVSARKVLTFPEKTKSLIELFKKI
jgi:hypothetical protein